MKRHAFTLIEILVVVSIIGLLIAILLPTLMRARDSANEMACLSNMRSLIQAQTSYAIDQDGLPPHYQEWIWGRGNLDNHPTGKTLPGGVTAFAQYAADYTSTKAPEFGTLNPYVSDFQTHFCPNASEMPINGLKGGYTPEGDKVLRSYVQNSRVYPDGYTMETVTKPSELLMLTEENTFITNFKSMPGFKQHFGPHPMNDGKLDLVWDSIGSIHRRPDADNLRSGYASGAFMDGSADWVFSQAMVEGDPKSNATIGFATDHLNNPAEQNSAFIEDSTDYSFSY